MANGLLSRTNHATEATISGLGWAGLDTLPTLPLGVPARSADPAPGPIRLRWAAPKPTQALFLGSTNLQQAAELTVTRFSDTAASIEIDRQTKPVVPRLYTWDQMYWGHPGLFRGNLETAVYTAYPRIAWMTFDRALCGGMDIQVDDAANPDGYLQIGFLFTGTAQRFRINYATGQRDIVVPNGSVARTAGGHAFVEPGQPTRRVEIPWDYMADGDQEVLADTVWSQQQHGPVVWLPDTDQPALCFRHGGVFQIRGETALDRAYWDRSSTTTLTLEGVTR
ncbi:hypothetical protein [Roseospira visakhapatnamensis]|uniref:Uncharacterized protein n=1 Tax=Roseospira visakhapatnamensis TaxID=390880 RepID=A0A7W6RGU1_9PROT|nr:hypothetical protein [Roseospira visakhapatnamensis]MBB4267736.1 hypothetical protein [Roseospira visakhapatnamensis]